jgi:hypothetical protein
MVWRILFAFAIAITMQAQPDPAELLRMVRATVDDSLDRVPKYMCTQTIERSQFEPDLNAGNNVCDGGPALPPTHLASSDRLRLDVAMTSTVEMYSWVGESRFDDRDLMDMVHEGAISTGGFAAFLKVVFRTDDARFSYNGDGTENGQAVSEFGYQVTLENSHYRFGGRLHGAKTAYDGTIVVDAKTGDLVRLMVRTTRLPAETGACYASTTLNYSRMHLNGSEILLPTESRLRITDIDGRQSVNHTVFSACHAFLGESTISFDPPTEGVGASKTKPQNVTLPAGLPFQVALTRAIDSGTAAVGDPIPAKLMTPIRKGSKVLIPAGAPVVARVVRLRQFYGRDASVALDIKLDTVEIGGASIRLNAAPDAVRRFTKSPNGTLQRRVDLGSLRTLEDRSFAYVFRNVYLPYVIASGLESNWTTAPAPTR